MLPKVNIFFILGFALAICVWGFGLNRKLGEG